jgi:hypothetical protein
VYLQSLGQILTIVQARQNQDFPRASILSTPNGIQIPKELSSSTKPIHWSIMSRCTSSKPFLRSKALLALQKLLQPLLIYILLVCNHLSIGQSVEIDSLKGVLARRDLTASNLAEIYFLLSAEYGIAGKLTNACLYADSALFVAKDSTLISKCYRIKGQLLSELQQFQKAIEMVQLSKNYLTVKSETREKVIHAITLGNACALTGKYDKAFSHYFEALLLANKIKNRYNIYTITQNLGVNFYKACDYKMAINYLNDALMLCEEKTDYYVTATNLALAYNANGEGIRAIKILKSVRSLEEQINQHRRVYFNYACGVTHLSLRNYDSAVLFLGTSLQQAKHEQNDRMVAENHLSLATTYIKSRRFGLASGSIDTSERIAKLNNYGDILWRVHKEKINLSKLTNNLRLLVRAQKDYINKKDELYNRDASLVLASRKAAYFENNYRKVILQDKLLLEANQRLEENISTLRYLEFIILLFSFILLILTVVSLATKSKHKGRLESGMLKRTSTLNDSLVFSNSLLEKHLKQLQMSRSSVNGANAWLENIGSQEIGIKQIIAKVVTSQIPPSGKQVSQRNQPLK